jgi:hypothetical protein
MAVARLARVHGHVSTCSVHSKSTEAPCKAVPNPFQHDRHRHEGEHRRGDLLLPTPAQPRSTTQQGGDDGYVALSDLSAWSRQDTRALRGRYRPASVPEWCVGCWKRKVVTFAAERYLGRSVGPLVDDTSFVVWLQTGRRCADLRLKQRHPAHPSSLSSPPQQHRQLATTTARSEADGWLGCCRVSPPWRWSLAGRAAPGLGLGLLEAAGSARGGVMLDGDDAAVAAPAHRLAGTADWFEDESCGGLPTTSKYPEPGELRRVGETLLEFAPSGAYVEDWRLQPGSAGLVASLVLLPGDDDDDDDDDASQPQRGTHLVVCGEHEMLVRDRPFGSVDLRPYTEGVGAALPLEDHVRRLLLPMEGAADAGADAGVEAEVAALLDFEVSYAMRGGVVTASTHPERVGSALLPPCGPGEGEGGGGGGWRGATLDPTATGCTAAPAPAAAAPDGHNGIEAAAAATTTGVGVGVTWHGMLVRPLAGGRKQRWGIESWSWLGGELGSATAD